VILIIPKHIQKVLTCALGRFFVGSDQSEKIFLVNFRSLFSWNELWQKQGRVVKHIGGL